MNFYQHKKIEAYLNHNWSKVTNCDFVSEKKNFAIVLPPPNVTGTLHLGHAWNTILQDVLIRYHKIQGYNLFWAIGMDHAGIATQINFYKQHPQLLNDPTITRDALNQLIHNWKEQHAQQIRKQWKKLGLAINNHNERFTLDHDSQKITLDAFITLFQKGLVYRANKIVNWDCQLQTAISNIEVIHQQVRSYIYKVKYYSTTNSKEYLEVLTTRLETIFADVCLVVHPDDKRYQKLIGQLFINPVNHQPLKLIADCYVDPEFGSGVMKCTPGHDFNDYELGLKYQLPVVQCIGYDGRMLENCGQYKGLKKEDCRQQLVLQLTNQGLLKVEEYDLTIALSERTNVVIEPMLSQQWFLKTSVLAKKVSQIIKTNPTIISFWPKNYAHTIFRYLAQMEDWCLSRQLTWGIRLPVWYHCKTKEIKVQKTPPDNSGLWFQDPDVFDTWFSSGLWPLITTNTYFSFSDIYQQFYPTSVLVTGVDILLFWVCRMMMFGAFFKNSMPFQAVYLHGLIRDQNHKKMSKSLGNGIDPEVLINEYGADALRLFFVAHTNCGEDLIYSKQKIILATKFLNKLWNAHLFLNLKITNWSEDRYDYQQLSWLGKWILSRLQKVKTAVKSYYPKFQFNLIAKKVINFVWDDFCNWYLEFLKVEIIDHNYQKLTSYLWQQILLLLNPIVPFITEYFYQQIHPQQTFYDQTFSEQELAVIAEHPWFFGLIRIIRTLRNQLKLNYQKKLFVYYDNQVLADQVILVINLLKIVNIDLKPKKDTTQSLIGLAINCYRFYLVCDQSTQITYRRRLIQKIADLTNEVARSEKILHNELFLKKAKREKVELEQNKLLQYQQELASYQAILQLQE